ncbi:MAG: imidazolonepropionase-like amidohydrolase [Myxococcota bacterium]|jgi:imidazolonepropionase-like amidohydrolase
MPDHRLTRRHTLALLAAAAVAPRARAAAPGDQLDGWLPIDRPLQGSFTLSNATLLSHTGQRTTGGVRVEDGIITELGAGVRGGEDLGGGWLSPGFTDSGCQVGLVEVGAVGSSRDTSVSGDAVTADARVIDGYNPLSEVIATTRANGITHALIHPSTSHLVTGLAAVVQLAGLTRSEATVRSPAALCINLGNAGRGEGLSSRIAVSRRLRQLLDEAPEPPAEDDGSRRRRRRQKDDDGGGDGDLTEAEQVWKDARAGKLKVIFKAERLDDIHEALDFIRDYELDGVLLGGAEAYLAADRIAGAGVPMLLGPLEVQPSSFEHPHAIYENASRLHRAGVVFGVRSDGVHFARILPAYVGMAVAHGLPFEAGIQALTVNPGVVLGLDEGHGTMAVGAPATFFQVDGDPLQPRYSVRRVWIGGRQASLESRQTRLYEKYRTLF